VCVVVCVVVCVCVCVGGGLQVTLYCILLYCTFRRIGLLSFYFFRVD
jgi:hypothetical protein